MTEEQSHPTGGAALTTYRRGAGLTQVQMAKKLGCSQGYLSDVERGKIQPGRGFITRVVVETAGAVPVTIWFANPKEAERGAA